MSRVLFIETSKAGMNPIVMRQGIITYFTGANLLTNKDGTVKLADFGVASKTAGVTDNSVVGSPYWSSYIKSLFGNAVLILSCSGT